MAGHLPSRRPPLRPTAPAGPACARPPPSPRRTARSARGRPAAPMPRATPDRPPAARSAAASGGTCARRHQQPGHAVHHLLARAADVGGDHRQAGQHRLDHRHRQALEMAGQGEDVGRRQHGGDVLAIAEQAQPRAQAGGAQHRAPCPRRGRRRAARPPPTARRRHLAHRRDQLGVALVAHQARHGDDHDAVVRHARAPRGCGHAPPGRGGTPRGRGRCRPGSRARLMRRRRASAASSVETVR